MSVEIEETKPLIEIKGKKYNRSKATFWLLIVMLLLGYFLGKSSC